MLDLQKPRSITINRKLRNGFLMALAIAALVAGIFIAGNALATWHYNEFTKPFLGQGR